MAFELRGIQVGGAGRTVETYGAYVGGYIKPSNHNQNRRDRRLVKIQNSKRRVVVIVRKRGGRALPPVFKSEGQATAWIKSRVSADTAIIAAEVPSWNELHGRFKFSRIDHSLLYTTGTGGYTNGAENFFSRIRRAEVGRHHHIAGVYLIRYVQAPAWREDHRRMDDGRQVQAVSGLAKTAPTSVDWWEYGQQSQKAM